MSNLFEISKQNQQAARNILHETGIIPIWESLGATVHLVGSLKSELMMKKRDIDLHIYTDKLNPADSFRAMAQIVQNPAIREVTYINLMDTEEECIEWHAWYEDKENNRCKIDMIHIRKGSKYDGFVERVTDAIIAQLTPQTREAILRIKFDMPEEVNIPGIEVYQAVFSGGVRNYEGFTAWRAKHPFTNSMEWMP